MSEMQTVTTVDITTAVALAKHDPVSAAAGHTLERPDKL